VAGSLAWGILVDGFRPDRYDLVGAALCLVGVAVIMYAPVRLGLAGAGDEEQRCPNTTRRPSGG
jgi:drug/metabolite transporter (DMT)-like permease